MTDLGNLKDTTRPVKRRKRVGRGPSSGMGKTSTRGVKGAGARSGWKSRATYEGGQFRLFQKLPQRGFSRARFQKKLDAVNLSQIDRFFQDGETVNNESLQKHGFIDRNSHGVKILGEGEITKKLAGFEVDAISSSAREKIEKAKIPLTVK